MDLNGRGAAKTSLRAYLSKENAELYLHANKPMAARALVEVEYKEDDFTTVYSQGQRRDLMQLLGTLKIKSKTKGTIIAPVTMSTKINNKEFKPLPRGTYPILVPEYSHPAEYTAFYRDVENRDLRSDQVWFRLEYGNGTIFIHPGNVSEACVTVMDFSKWHDIHEYLLSHRVENSKYLGDLKVTVKPKQKK